MGRNLFSRIHVMQGTESVMVPIIQICGAYGELKTDMLNNNCAPPHRFAAPPAMLLFSVSIILLTAAKITAAP